tara:strand:- start:880 stop:2082 length:1203 start_codon:yes stop_codon:yes gene_type:complete
MDNFFTLEEIPELPGGQDSKLEVLLLANEGYTAGCCSDYINAIEKNSAHNITIRNPMAKSRMDKLLARPYTSLLNESGHEFDVIIIHYSICIIYRNYISHLLRRKIRKFKGIKIVIIQDEYRWINRIVNEMVYLEVDGIVSLLDKENIKKVYSHPKLDKTLKISALAGYVSNYWVGQKVLPISLRPKHIIYRGNRLPFWLGNAAYEKTVLAEKVSKYFQNKNLNLDVSSNPEDRIYGENWLSFMNSGKTVIGLEGGASIFDFDESIEKTVSKYLLKNPSASYDTVHQKFLSSSEDNIYYRMITPRSFEAISMKTVQIMYPGEYSGILEPWKHYIPMERDFSNLNNVIETLANDELLQEIADRAYIEIIESNKYSEEKLGKGIDACICFLLQNKSLIHSQI